MEQILMIVLIVLAFSSCKIESGKSCWQVIDCTGSALQTETEMQTYVNSISTTSCQKNIQETYKKQ